MFMNSITDQCLGFHPANMDCEIHFSSTVFIWNAAVLYHALYFFMWMFCYEAMAMNTVNVLFPNTTK